MDFQVICRICLEPNKESCDIFSSYYLKRNTLYAEMLASCTKLKPTPEDSLPRQICKECTKQLKRAYSFNLLCDESDKILHSYLQTSITKDLLKENHLKNEDEVKCELSKDENVNVNTEHIDYEILDDSVEDIKEAIKLEPNDSYWDADDNTLLRDIKSNPEDELDSYCPQWTTLAPNRDEWREDREAFALQWDDSEAENAIHEERPELFKKKRGRKKKAVLFDGKAALAISKCPHQCDECGKVLSNKSNLKAHKVCHTDLRPYACGDCPATFRGHSALFQHRRVHTGETPYHCEYCPKQFSRRTGLVNHIRMHTGEKQFSCDICFKTFVQSAQLSIHMKRHKGDKPYLCQDCGKGFPIKSDLKVHQRIHNGEKPYSCHLCTKTFATSGNLSIHIRIHKKEIRYNCKECQRGFVTHSSYALHQKRHKGQRDYSCECGKTFYTSSALKQHKVVHTGEKNYQCKICERKFTQTSHLSRHFKRDHAKNVPSEQYKVVVGKSIVMIESTIGMNVKCETVA